MYYNRSKQQRNRPFSTHQVMTCNREKESFVFCSSKVSEDALKCQTLDCMSSDPTCMSNIVVPPNISTPSSCQADLQSALFFISIDYRLLGSLA